MKINMIPKTLTIAFAFICAIGLILTATPAISADTTVIRWAHPSPKKGYEPELMSWIQKEIKARTNGRVEIQIFWGGSLAGFKEMGEAVESGMADVGWVTSSYHPGYMELSGAAHSAALLNPENDPVEYMKKFYQFLEELPDFYEYEANKNNMVPFSPVYYDEYWFFSKKPIRNIEDLKGVKIRAISEPRQIAMKAVGAAPTFIGAGEMYSALQKGIIDAVSYSPDTAKRYNIHEITDYLTRISLHPGVAYWAMNLDTFKKLNWIDQKAVLNVGREAAMKKAAWMAKERKRALKTFKEAGMEVIDFPKSDEQKLDGLKEFDEYGRDWVAENEKKGMAARKAMNLFCETFDVPNPLKQKE